jgi:adenylate cyclase
MLTYGNSKDQKELPETPAKKAGRPSIIRQLFHAYSRSIRRLLPTHIPVAIKLAIYIGILISVGMSLLGAVIIHNQSELLNRQIHSTGRTVVSQMAESAKEPILANDSLQLDLLTYNLATDEDILGTTIYSTDLKIISSAGINPFDNNAPYNRAKSVFLDGSTRTLKWEWKQPSKNLLEAISFIKPIRFKDVNVGFVLITFSRSAMTQAINASVQSILTATAILIFLGIITSYFLGRRLTRPLDHLMDASRAIGMGQFDYRIDKRRNDEIGHLMHSFNSMAQGMLEKKQVEDAFSRHVSPNIAKEILSNLDEVKLGGEHVDASVMFIDIVGFTEKSESMNPEGVAELLNDFYSNITQTAHFYQGTIDKYMGDCAMIIFGVPEHDPDHVFHAIAYSVFLQHLAERINEIRIAQNKTPIFYRIGLNAGDMLAGNMGSKEHVQYTVVGDSVNLASRLCTAATRGQIIISEEIYNLPGISNKIIATQYQSIHVRGKSEAISIYLVHDLVEEYQAAMHQQINTVLSKNRQMTFDLNQ